MSRRRGIADSVSESAPMADSAIIFGNAQLLTPGNGYMLRILQQRAATGLALRAHPVPLAAAESAACSLFSSTILILQKW